MKPGLISILLGGALGVCGLAVHADETPAGHEGRNVLYINAYHAGYEWSDSEQRGIEQVLKAAGVPCRVVYMDTKRRKSSEEIQAAAAQARMVIDTSKPDIVVMSDDNPVRHVLVPWYMNAAVPFVFCGVNWDCSRYGLPCTNVTGMLEVSLFPQLLKTVVPLARGSRIAILCNDNETDHWEGEWIPKKFGVKWAAERYVRTFAEWKAAYLALQEQADILFLYGTAGIDDWDEAEAIRFTQENTRAMTCSTQDYMKQLVVVGYMKSGEEQGNWAAHAALKILDGAAPATIPVTENKTAKITLNMTLAKRLGKVFPLDLLKHAEMVK